MDLFTYLLGKKGQNTQKDLFSYLLGKNAGGSGTYTTFSGTSLNISNTLQAKIKNIALEGNTSQDGTPTPDTPVPIKVVTGEQSVKIHNKNLFNKDNDVTLKKQASFSGTEDNEFTTSSSNIRTLIITRVPSNSKITLSINNDNYIQSRYFICQLKTPTIEAGKNEQWYTGNSTIVTTDKTNYLGIVLEIKKNGTIVYSTQKAIDEMKFQIEEGPTVTSYVPYQKQTYPLSLGNIELAKIGNYKDYIFKNVVGSPYYNADLELNEWYLKKNIEKMEFNNNNVSYAGTWLGYNNVTPILIKKDTNDVSYGNNLDHPIFCTKAYHSPTIPDSTDYLGAISVKSQADYYYLIMEYGTTVAQARNILNGGYLYYQLATPQYIHISQADYPVLRNQLENLYNNAKSYKGQTNITQTNDGLPFNISVDVKVANL